MRRPPTVLILWQALSVTLLLCAAFFGVLVSFAPALDWTLLLWGTGVVAGPPAAALYCMHRGAHRAAHVTMLLGMIVCAFATVCTAMGMLSIAMGGALLGELPTLVLFALFDTLALRATLLQGEAARRMRCGEPACRPTLRIER